jgi:hypothetical protein
VRRSSASITVSGDACDPGSEASCCEKSRSGIARAPPGGPPAIAGFVGDDRQQPGPEGLSRSEAAQGAMGLHEGVLGRFFRVRDVPADEHGRAKGDLLVGTDNVGVRGGVTVPGALDEVGFGRQPVHRCHPYTVWPETCSLDERAQRPSAAMAGMRPCRWRTAKPTPRSATAAAAAIGHGEGPSPPPDAEPVARSTFTGGKKWRAVKPSSTE